MNAKDSVIDVSNVQENNEGDGPYLFVLNTCTHGSNPPVIQEFVGLPNPPLPSAGPFSSNPPPNFNGQPIRSIPAPLDTLAIAVKPNSYVIYFQVQGVAGLPDRIIIWDPYWLVVSPIHHCPPVCPVPHHLQNQRPAISSHR
jgi:hypothetical protein